MHGRCVRRILATVSRAETADHGEIGSGARDPAVPAGQTVADWRTTVVLLRATGSPNRKLLVTTVPFQASSW